MKEQPRRPKEQYSLDLSYDDDFFDLPPYEPHAEEPDKQPKEHVSLRDTARSTVSALRGIHWRRHLITPILALIVTAIVVLIAYGAATTTPPDDTADTPPDTPPVTEPEPQPEPEPEPEPQPEPEPYDYATDVSAYMGAIEYAPAKGDILLLNKQNPRPNYAPEQLVSLTATYTLYGKSIDLEPTTAAALQAMLLCMRADGITDTYVTSGYRSYTYQSQLFALYVNQEMSKNPTLSREQATAIAERYSARPGYSEHQSGLCVDLMTTTMGSLDVSFEKTAAFAWLQENAAQFGFILRYPKEKEDITGYTYEPWHYRFVGRAAALEIKAADLTLEEYLGQLGN
jgi:D-alanyl-D-alanine carboxypeptidase